MNGNFPAINQCPLRHWSLKTPEQPALLLNREAVSYRLLDSWVEQCQQEQLHGVIEAGQHLAVVTDNMLGTLLLALACLREGVVFGPVNPAFPDTQRQAYYQTINAFKITHASEVSCSAIHQHYKQEQLIAPDAVMDLIATSGTSGVPKAVAHSYRNHYSSAMGSQDKTPLIAGDSWLLSLPLFHVGGFAIVIRCLQAGATMVLDSFKTPLPKLLGQTRISHLSLVNTQLYRLLKDNVSLHQMGVRYILLGGGIASPVLVDKVLRQGVELLTTYGMTEMASQVCTGKPVFTDGSVTSGEILPEREVCLSDENEILVRGQPLTLGYYRNGELVPVTDEQGWYHTGDQGCWHEKQLQVTGRIDNLFISGGENIHPEEIEQALLMLPEIIQAVVVAENDTEYGKRPVAYVQTENGRVDEGFTKKNLAGKIAGFKIPGKIRPFPYNMVNTGIKVNRRLFQQLNDS